MKTMLSKPLVAAAIVTFALGLPACGSDDSDSSKESGAAGAREGKDGGESDGSVKAKVVASNSDKGKYPSTLAHASLKNPGAIKMKITADPEHTTHAAWTVACRKGRSAKTSADRFTVRRPVTKSMNRPFTNPDSCEVSASAQMVKRGTIKVQILERPIPSDPDT